jgi:hypothetical protein
MSEHSFHLFLDLRVYFDDMLIPHLNPEIILVIQFNSLPFFVFYISILIKAFFIISYVRLVVVIVRHRSTHIERPIKNKHVAPWLSRLLTTFLIEMF